MFFVLLLLSAIVNDCGLPSINACPDVHSIKSIFHLSSLFLSGHQSSSVQDQQYQLPVEIDHLIGLWLVNRQ